MRLPVDFIVGGFLIAFLSVVPLGAGFVLGNEWSPIGFVGAVVMWSVGGLLAQIGVIGAGVHIGSTCAG